jgi:hypothetical protein
LKRPVLRLAVQIATVVLLLAAVLLVLGPVRAELERRFGVIRDDAVAQLENLIGRRVTYSRVSPSILRYLSVHDLTIHGREDEPADLLSVEQLRIYYRPIRLLQGRYAEAFSEIRIENTELTLDTRLDSDLTALLADIMGTREAAHRNGQGGDSDQSAAGGSGRTDAVPDGRNTAYALADLLPEDLVVSGRNIRMNIRSRFGLVETERLFFSTTLAEETVNVRFQGDARLLDAPESFPLANVTGRLEAAGTVNVATGDTLLEVDIPELSSDLATLRSQVLQVRFNEGVLEARNVQNRDPIDLYVRYIDDTGELYARVLADGYRMSDLVELEGEYEQLNRYLRLPLRGQANATVTPESLSFGGSLLTQIAGFRQIPDGDLTLRFDGDSSGVTIDELTYVTGIGTAYYSGDLQLSPLRPDGVLTVERLTYGGIDPLSLTASLTSTDDVIAVRTGRFAYAGTTFRSLAGNVNLAGAPETNLTVDIGSAGESRLEVETSHDENGSLRRARIDARRVEPSRLVDIQEAVLPDLPIPDISVLPDAMVVDTRLMLDLTEGLNVDIPLFYAFDADDPDDHISFSLAYDNGAVNVRDLTASYEGYEGRGDFTAQLENGGAIAFTSDVVVEEIPYEFSGRFDPGNSLEISGLYDVEANFYFGERGELMFSASGDVPLPLQSSEASTLAFSGDGYFFSADDWSVNVERLTASGLSYATVESARIGLTGRFSPSGARLATLTYEDAFSALSGNGEVAWNLDSRSGTVAVALSGAEGEEAYEVSASYADETLEASAQVQRLPLLRLDIETVRGALNGSAEVAGPLNGLATRVSGELVEGRFNTDPVELAATVEVDPQTIRIVDASGRYVRNRAEDVTGVLSLEDGSLAVSGTLVQPGENGGLSVGIDASGSFSELVELGDVVSADFAGSLTLTGLPVREDLPAEWGFRINRVDGTTVAEGGPNRALAFTLQQDGEFTARLGDPIPLRFDAIGFLEGGQIEADLTNVWGDIARLWAIVESQGFTFTDGIATGSARIVGPLNDPDFYGTLVAENVAAGLDLIPDTIGPARTFIVFDEKLMSVRETTVSAGPGIARVSMEAVLDRWLPAEYRVGIATEDDTSVRLVNDFGGVGVDARAAGSISVNGDRGTTRITGDVTASETTITLTERPEQPFAGEQPGDTRVDITVNTDRGVQFLWPTSALPILRGFADVDESVRITYESAASTYSVTGGVDIQGGEVFYFDRSFYIREGRITFDEDEQGFDPLLTVNAEIREVAEEGPVRIYLVADERPLSEFTPRWRSDPPLTEAAILALLGGNVFVSETGEPIDLEQAAWLASDVVSQFGIIRGFESSVREALQLDLFSVRTQLFQNLLRGVIDPGQEYPLDNEVPSLGEYLDNTTLFMGKYLGTDLFLELLVQLRASEPLAVEPRSLAGIEVESEFSLEWQTPFFLLEWTFFPRDPSSLFLADNTISFQWEYSY